MNGNADSAKLMQLAEMRHKPHGRLDIAKRQPAARDNAC